MKLINSEQIPPKAKIYLGTYILFKILTNWDFIYSASLVIHPKNGKHESRHKRHDALESIREYSIFRPPHNTSQT